MPNDQPTIRDQIMKAEVELYAEIVDALDRYMSTTGLRITQIEVRSSSRIHGSDLVAPKAESIDVIFTDA